MSVHNPAVDQSRSDTMETTFLRVAIAFGIVIGGLALLATVSTASGWRASPALGPHGLQETVISAAFVFVLWAVNIGLFLGFFAGGPWVVIHSLGLRSWWIAPVVGFVMAFCIGCLGTAMGGYDFGLHGSASIDGKATMIDGILTPYGRSLYGLMAALRAGVGRGAAGAVLGLLLWRIAYRRV